LNEVQAAENEDSHLQGLELCDRKQRRKNRCHERADERNVVKSEGDDAPFRRKLKAGNRSEGPDE